MTNTASTGLSIRTADWARDSAILHEIRERVFVEEQGVPAEEELDAHDPMAQHFLVFLDSRPVATGRLLNTGQIGRMAVLQQARGLGVGKQLLEYIVEYASNTGQSKLFLHAQVHALDFYRKCGFVVYGELFLDAGIEHRHMELLL